MSNPWMSEQDIVLSYKNAVSPVAHPRILAQINGCPVRTIKNILIRHGCLPEESPAGIPSDADTSLLRKLHMAGLTDTTIARQTGYSKAAVAAWRVQNGLKQNSRTVDYHVVRDLYYQDLTDYDIADAVGCGVEAVRRWRYRNNLPPNGPGFIQWQRRKKDA